MSRFFSQLTPRPVLMGFTITTVDMSRIYFGLRIYSALLFIASCNFCQIREYLPHRHASIDSAAIGRFVGRHISDCSRYPKQ